MTQNIFVLHITSQCPYNCHICFSNKVKGFISDGLLEELIELAKQKNVRFFNFSGGEPLLHPQLEHLVRKTVANNISVNIVTSGFGLNENKLLSILEAGVSRIFISLDSTKEEINVLSREGFRETIDALKLISKIAPTKSAINFCVGHENIGDFLSIAGLAKQLSIPLVCVLQIKPNKKGEQISAVSEEQLVKLADDIKSQTDGPIVAIDPCFTELSKLLEKTNAVTLPLKLQGCNPGIRRLSFYPDRTFSLCPHLTKRYPIGQLPNFIKSNIQPEIKLCFKQLN